jgi:hypothetical protein
VKVSVKDFAVGMEVKNKGIELEIRTPQGAHVGDLVVTSTKLVWCEGRTQRENGKTITWEKFREMMNGR